MSLKQKSKCLLRLRYVFILIFIYICPFASAAQAAVGSHVNSDNHQDLILSCKHCESLMGKSSLSIPYLEYNWYFTLEASQAVFERRGTDEYLILNYYNEMVQAYSDRPHELTEKFNIKELVNLWHQVYLNSLPKSTVSGYQNINGNIQPVFLYVQLSEPRIISDHTIEFVIFPLNDDSNLKSGMVIHKAVVDMTEDYASIHTTSPYHIK